MSSGATTGTTFAEHFAAHQQVVRQSVVELADVAETVMRVLVDALQNGNKVIAFGNGGSAAEASHLVGELIGRFSKNRRPLPAVSLVGDPGSVTCIANDFGYVALFERQVEGLARPGDIAFGLTTSGKSENVKRGLAAAQRAGAIAVALTGAAGLVDATADYVVAVPSVETASIQEVHLMLIHAWCQGVDKAFA
jgi:D-sedoheptulose 7-phosphate isomerase